MAVKISALSSVEFDPDATCGAPNHAAWLPQAITIDHENTGFRKPKRTRYLQAGPRSGNIAHSAANSSGVIEGKSSGLECALTRLRSPVLHEPFTEDEAQRSGMSRQQPPVAPIRHADNRQRILPNAKMANPAGHPGSAASPGSAGPAGRRAGAIPGPRSATLCDPCRGDGSWRCRSLESVNATRSTRRGRHFRSDI